MLIYRLEHPDSGRGPYVSTGHASTASWTWSRRPPPADDLGLAGKWLRLDDAHFGFASVEQLKRWFDPTDPDIEVLTGEGYEVVTYEVPDEAVILGHKQLVFTKHLAAEVDSVPLVDVLFDTMALAA